MSAFSIVPLLPLANMPAQRTVKDGDAAFCQITLDLFQNCRYAVLDYTGTLK